MPLKGVPSSDTYHDFFPARYVADYLECYVDSKVCAGRSLASRIHFHSEVETLRKVEQGWVLHIRGHQDGGLGSAQFVARKVIDATGLTSNPNMPSIPGQDEYRGQMLHVKDFGRQQDSILRPKGPRRVAVIGGAKSAADVAYVCAKAGNEVDWIIRRSGAGPAAFVSAKASWPYGNSNESFYNRFTSHFLVSWFFDESKTWLGRFLYHTNLGRAVITKVWKAINHKARALANYDREDGRRNGFYNLKPDTDIFWQNDSTGVCQRDDFFDVVAHRVKVHRQDIRRMTDHGLELADGTDVQADSVVFATGWKRSHPRFRVSEEEQDLMVSLGLAAPEHREHDPSAAHWNALEAAAKKNVYARFPILLDRPPHHTADSSNSVIPLRLYKGILPINDRSIAFVGQMLLGNNFRNAEVQALYAVSALDGTLSLPSKAQMEMTVAHTVVWDRLRYLSKGQPGNWLYWDLIPYTDDLLHELGLRSHRHNNGWKDMFAPCFARDLTGLIEEYRMKSRKGRNTELRQA